MRGRYEPAIPGKLTVRAGGRKLVLAKRAGESERHVLLKALVFALYVDRYPNLTVERDIGRRYRPDLVALDPVGDPIFWAECGETGRDKIECLVRSLCNAHLVVAKQGVPLAPVADLIRAALPTSPRRAPIDLLGFPADAGDGLLPNGEISIGFDDVQVVRL